MTIVSSHSIFSIDFCCVGRTTVGHARGGNHDTFVKILGPGPPPFYRDSKSLQSVSSSGCCVAASQVHHHFATRWNDAKCSGPRDVFPSREAASPLPFPTKWSLPRQESHSVKAQVIRTLRPGNYKGSSNSNGKGFDIGVSDGEESIWITYRDAIKAAKRFIYLEVIINYRYLELREITLLLPLESAYVR